jgi:putative ATPase
MRPRSFDEFAGQKHLVGDKAPLRRAVEADRIPSCIFFGPAGTGKTTLARLVATLSKAHFEEFSAITGGVADVRKIVSASKERKAIGTRTVLFVDEIHRFNRAQQDAFLPHVEDGTITLIGATTENPLATLNTPLLSRCRLFKFEPLDDEEIIHLLRRAATDGRGLASLNLEVEEAALEHIARMALGDARTALGALEMAADLAVEGKLTLALAEEAIGRRALDYDKTGDNHYHIISAYIKSLRGGDPDAALYWMARMLEGGEDPMFIARRLAIQSSEDIGNADPRAFLVAMAALNAVEKIGLPEAAIPLAQATVYVATAPKSNASYVALHRAQDAVRNQPPAVVPMHLRAASLRGARERLGEGIGYVYPHDHLGHFIRQDYLPPGFKSEPFYEPTELGYEVHIARRLAQWWQDDPASEGTISKEQGKGETEEGL